MNGYALAFLLSERKRTSADATSVFLRRGLSMAAFVAAKPARGRVLFAAADGQVAGRGGQRPSFRALIPGGYALADDDHALFMKGTVYPLWFGPLSRSRPGATSATLSPTKSP